MATDINQIIIQGRLTREPEFKYTPGGMAVCPINIASNSSYKKKDSQEWTTEVVYINAVLWGNQAERLGQELHKGSPVIVCGQLKDNSWVDKNGNNKSEKYIKVISIQQLVVKSKNSNQSQNYNQDEQLPF